jgi:riboflavin kinase/FMN adenylyltransferase
MEFPAPCVATIGFFDGVHLGHQYLIEHVVAEAKTSGMESTVITFDEHPRKVLQSDYIPQMLCTFDSKLLLLSKTEIDNCAVLHFDKDMQNLSAREFMQKILRDRLNVKKLVIGYDNRFGHNRSEDFEDYVRYGKELGIEVIHNQAFTLNGCKVSSSVVRRYIEGGEIELANQCLGYPYTIAGKVVEGYQEGRKLGYPTANLDTSCLEQLVPSPGVYAVKVSMEQDGEGHEAMMNIGTRPTFGGTEQSLEVHIFNFDENIYGKKLFVSFLHRIREEHKFETVDDLKEQLRQDERLVEQQFDKEKKNYG